MMTDAIYNLQPLVSRPCYN